MNADYKKEQEKARQALRDARHGKEIVCRQCGTGSSGGTLVKTEKGYIHQKPCGIRGLFPQRKMNIKDTNIKKEETIKKGGV